MCSAKRPATPSSASSPRPRAWPAAAVGQEDVAVQALALRPEAVVDPGAVRVERVQRCDGGTPEVDGTATAHWSSSFVPADVGRAPSALARAEGQDETGASRRSV